MQIDLAHDRSVAVGIAQELLRAVESDHLQEIGKIARFVRHGRLVESLDVEALGREDLAMIVRRHHLDLLRFRAKDANHEILTGGMRAEDAKGIGMGTVEERSDLARIDRVNGK